LLFNFNKNNYDNPENIFNNFFFYDLELSSDFFFDKKKSELNNFLNSSNKSDLSYKFVGSFYYFHNFYQDFFFNFFNKKFFFKEFVFSFKNLIFCSNINYFNFFYLNTNIFSYFFNLNFFFLKSFIKTKIFIFFFKFNIFYFFKINFLENKIFLFKLNFFFKFFFIFFFKKNFLFFYNFSFNFLLNILSNLFFYFFDRFFFNFKKNIKNYSNTSPIYLFNFFLKKKIFENIEKKVSSQFLYLNKFFLYFFENFFKINFFLKIKFFKKIYFFIEKKLALYNFYLKFN